jgi:hypothetical protein
MQFIKDAIGHVLVFGLTLIVFFVAVVIEGIVRRADYQGEWLLRRWTLWGGLALMFALEDELRGLARTGTAWL